MPDLIRHRCPRRNLVSSRSQRAPAQRLLHHDLVPEVADFQPDGRIGGDWKDGTMTDFKWRHFQGDVILWAVRSEEHTSELQSLMRITYADFCLKKKNTINS